MKVVVTGQTGIGKGAFLRECVQIIRNEYGRTAELCLIDDFLRRQDPSFRSDLVAKNPGEFEKTYLLALREILDICKKNEHVIIEMHLCQFPNQVY